MEMWIEKFIKLYFYHVDVKAGIALKNEHIPDSLYKYHSFGDYTFSTLENNTGYLRDPSEFNDPYDSYIKTDPMKHAMSSLRDTFRVGMRKFYSETQIENALNNADVLDGMFRLLASSHEDIPSDHFVKSMKGIIQKQFDDISQLMVDMGRHFIKVCCFTEHPNNMLMWSHYANDHHGICVEYDWSKLSSDEILRVRTFPVIYVEDLPDFSDIAFDLNNPANIGMFTLMSLYKSNAWQYENEWRLIIDNRIFPDNINYPLAPIKSIIVGCNITDDNLQKIKTISLQKNIPLYKAVLSRTKYQLDIIPLE